MFCVFYRFLASISQLAVRAGRGKDLEVIVLRHQLTVVQRQVSRPQLNKMIGHCSAQSQPRSPAGYEPAGSSPSTRCSGGTGDESHGRTYARSSSGPTIYSSRHSPAHHRTPPTPPTGVTAVSPESSPVSAIRWEHPSSGGVSSPTNSALVIPEARLSKRRRPRCECR